MREKYLTALKKQLDEKIFTHSLALEACMGGLYDYFQKENLLNENDPPKEDWLLAGLIHETNFWSRGRTLASLGLEGLSPIEIRRVASDGYG